jgi:hypothetical protein
MTQKFPKISITVFTITTLFLFGFFMLTSSSASADQGYKGKSRQEVQKQKEKNTYGRGDYKEPPNYANYSGYRERPFDKNRRYGNYDYKGHRYDYRGHWRSWDQWDRYAKAHPSIYKHGTYYRENSHLMFRFCEPGTGNCFFFSIGM